MQYYIGTLPSDPNYLKHFGIPGMKWGERRYQNEDGTLTEAGKRRYGIGNFKDRVYKYWHSNQREYIKSRNPKEAEKRDTYRKMLDDPEIQKNKKLYKALRSGAAGFYSSNIAEELWKAPVKMVMNRAVIRPALRVAGHMVVNKFGKGGSNSKAAKEIIDAFTRNPDLLTDFRRTSNIGVVKGTIRGAVHKRRVNKYLSKKELERHK